MFSLRMTFTCDTPAIPAQDLMPWVFCELYEAIRCEHNRAVWQVRVADDKVLLNPFYSGCQIQRNTRKRLGRSHALANHTALLFFCFLQFSCKVRCVSPYAAL